MSVPKAVNDLLPARLSSEGLLRDYKLPAYRYYVSEYLPNGTRDWARVLLLQACERIGVPHKLWPKFEKIELPAPQIKAGLAPQPLNLPIFNVFQENATEWRERAEAAFRRHCDEFLAKCHEKIDGHVEDGFLSQVERPKEGSTPVVLRYEWAARRYCNKAQYKSMETEEHSADKIRHAVKKIFSEAGITGKAVS